MKRLNQLLKPLLLAVCIAGLLVACATKTPQKIAVDTLASLGQAVNDSYDGYLLTVVQGATPTNGVPQVTAYYRDFQVAFGVAAAGAHFATNTTLATPELVNLATKVTTAITTIKGK